MNRKPVLLKENNRARGHEHARPRIYHRSCHPYALGAPDARRVLQRHPQPSLQRLLVPLQRQCTHHQPQLPHDLQRGSNLQHPNLCQRRRFRKWWRVQRRRGQRLALHPRCRHHGREGGQFRPVCNAHHQFLPLLVLRLDGTQHRQRHGGC